MKPLTYFTYDLKQLALLIMKIGFKTRKKGLFPPPKKKNKNIKKKYRFKFE